MGMDKSPANIAPVRSNKGFSIAAERINPSGILPGYTSFISANGINSNGEVVGASAGPFGL